MPIGNQELLNLTVLSMIAITGCSSNERLADLAQHELEIQHTQNETIARQSSAVVNESHQLAVAAKDLVSQDAQARQELILPSMICTASSTKSGAELIESAKFSRTSAARLPASASGPGNRRSHSGSRGVTGLFSAAVTRRPMR